MKKVLAAVILVIQAFVLTSCRVNWFGARYDVPWYFVAVPVAIIFIVSYVVMISGTYVCPQCKTEFKPKWYQLYVVFHFNGKRVVKCPKCGRKGFCDRTRG